MIYCYDDMSNGSSPKLANAFALGCNGIVTNSIKYLGYESFFFGSPHIWEGVIQQAIKSNNNWYYGDHAFLGKRGLFYRISKNRYQNDGNGESNGKRLKRLNLDLKAWHHGKHIVVCPPDRAFALLMGFDSRTWIEDVSRKIAENTDREIIWRDRLNIIKPLNEDLKDAHLLITYTSNSAVESIVNGVPVFCLGECAARDMGIKKFEDIENPIYCEDRLRFLSVLADNQWTLDEIKSGLCYQKLKGE